MRKPNRAVTVALGLLVLLAVFGAAGCGNKTPETPPGTSVDDAAKHMGGPPPSNTSSAGNQPPAGYMGRRPGGPGGPPR